MKFCKVVYAQASFELFLTTGFAMILLIIIIISYSINMDQNIIYEKKLQASRICDQIVGAILYALISGPGTNISIRLQDNINDINYVVYMLTNDSRIIITIPTSSNPDGSAQGEYLAYCKTPTMNITNSNDANAFFVNKNSVIRSNEQRVITFVP